MKIYNLMGLFGGVLFSLNSSAALYDRGDGMIYDSVLNITWLQDANYAVSSGWAASHDTGHPNIGPQYIQSNGRMGQEAAVNWADQLMYGGFDDWRLPTIGANPITGYNSGGELGYMFYVNLGNKILPTSVSASFIDAATGKIEQLQNVQDGYWYSEEAGNPPIGAWFINFDTGFQGAFNKASSYYAWAVRDGDVAAVPAPATIWLFGSALFGLAWQRIRNKYFSC